MKASDLFVKQLEEEGVEYIFGLPGEENLDLLESLRTSSIKVIITRHEQAAAFMAATYGRLTGKAGVCFSTLGPGATNLVTGVAHAQLIGAPFVSISGQKAIRDELAGPVPAHRRGEPDAADHQGLRLHRRPEHISRRSSGTLSSSRRQSGPVLCTSNCPRMLRKARRMQSVQKRGLVRRPAPDPKTIVRAAELINTAQRPLIILSSGANRNLITRQLMQFIEKTGIYAVHTQMGKGVLSDASDYSLFATGIHKRDYVNCGIDRADADHHDRVQHRRISALCLEQSP